jgi:tetratricopeptide (TPR) repeat protein
VQILGASRTEEDITGWDIPRLYFEFLRDGDPTPLKRVFYHNAMDVISMVALFNHMAGVLDDPFGGAIQHAADWVAVAKLYEDLGDVDRAARLYIHALEHADDWPQRLPLASLIEAIERLAQIHKHQDNLEAAVVLWQQAAQRQHLDAHVELAKFYEHRLRDYPAAVEWTESAIALVRSPLFTPFERRQRLPDLQHRLSRLQRKQAAGAAGLEESPPASDE